MIEELKPCPFCGGDGAFTELEDDGYAQAVCVCTASGPLRKGEAEAIAAWNTAYDPDKRLSRVETLFAAIEHGDEDHRAWLKEAIDKHFAGEAVPGPRGNGSADKRLREALEGAKCQLEYLNERCRRESTATVLAKIDAALSHNGG